MTKNRKWLVKSIDEILLPSLRRAGFFVVPLSKEDARSPEIRAAFPFGRLRRQRNAGFDQIEVQLDKRGGSALRLNLGFFRAVRWLRTMALVSQMMTGFIILVSLRNCVKEVFSADGFQ